eukprot:scpid104552/ scgid7663/ 
MIMHRHVFTSSTRCYSDDGAASASVCALQAADHVVHGESLMCTRGSRQVIVYGDENSFFKNSLWGQTKKAKHQQNRTTVLSVKYLRFAFMLPNTSREIVSYVSYV